jgi:hypothetical protein
MTAVCGKLATPLCKQPLSSIHAHHQCLKIVTFLCQKCEHLWGNHCAMLQQDGSELPIPAYIHQFWHRQQSISILENCLEEIEA